MKKINYLLLSVIATSPSFAANLASRLGVPLGITANDNCSASTDASRIAAQVSSIDVIIFQWSQMHSLQPVVLARAVHDRSVGLKVMLGMSPTQLTGLRTDIDLPTWVATACGLTQNTASFASPCLQAQFIADATTYAAAIQPEYFHLATEINTLILRRLVSPSDPELPNFGALYVNAAAAVKVVSPTSKVFVSFQYELQTKLEEDNPGAWDNLLSIFRPGGHSALDLVGYTTYPSSSPFLGAGKFQTASAVPADFYAPANRHLVGSERSAFTEIGWPTEGTGSEAGQKTFVDRLPELMFPAQPEIVAWALLHDVPTQSFGSNTALSTVGVRRCDGSAKAAWSILAGSGSSGTSSENVLDGIQVFPNPLQPAKGQTAITISGAPPAAQLRIYTLAGELVRDLSANDFGRASWDGINRKGRPVASGVYFLHVQSGSVSRTLKLGVQR